ncbi:MAG: hypothetical protein ACREA0_34440 [bacterium]
MGKELPILPSAPQLPETTAQDAFLYSRVFCQRENSPPLRLLLDFLKSHGQIPMVPKMAPAALDEWAWVQISLGYHRERKPIQLFCVRDRGSYQDVFEKERNEFLQHLSFYDDEEAQICREYVTRAKFIATTRLPKNDITEEGYDFNGWLLEFFQDQCNGIVQLDGKGFFSPKGDLIVDMDEDAYSPEADPASPSPSGNA